MAIEPHENRSVPDLLVDLLRETRDLITTESQLVRAEIRDKVRQVEAAGGSLAVGGIILLVALITLTATVVFWIAQIGDPDIGYGWSTLIVGVVLAIVGAIFLSKGKRDLKPQNLMPERSAHQLREDERLVKEQAR